MFSLFYGEGLPLAVILDSAASAFVFSLFAYFAWYTVALSGRIYMQAGVITLVLLLCLSAGHLVYSLISPGEIGWFIHSIPLRVLCGIMAWIILFQWYRWYLDRGGQNNVPNMPEVENEPGDVRDIPVVDRISVKDGSKIHLILTEELVYIQASGDYVTLFTQDKQYVKEQTMKSLISHLPPCFVRIHRSLIVNCDYIARIELYEKQSYRLRLKNGIYLKVSPGGYKLLKERLLI